MRYIIVEKNFTKKALEIILPNNLKRELKIVVATGHSSAISIAKSLHIRTEGKEDILLLLDSLILNQAGIDEKKHNINNLLIPISEKEIKVLMFIPCAEIIFFYYSNFLDDYFDRVFTDLEFDMGKRDPNHFLLINNDYKDTDELKIQMLNNMSQKNKEFILKYSDVFNGVVEFLKN